MPSTTDNPDVCRELFNRIYDETFNEMRRYVACRCADTQTVPDILQEIYLEYYRLILRRGCDYARDNRAVVYKIAGRKLFRFYSLKERLRIFIPLIAPDGEDGQTEELPDDGACFEDGVIERAESERIWERLSHYPADVRKIFYLYYYENMSHSEIARAMNCGVSNVKNKHYRTLGEIEAKGENLWIKQK